MFDFIFGYLALHKEVIALNWQDTLYRWELYSKKLYPLRDEVADIFKTKCFYDDNWQYQEREYEADEDTVFLLKLSDMLNNICNFVKSHIGVLEHRVDLEADIRANLEQAFESWKRGLCPVLMKTVPRYIKTDSMNFWENYDNVAQFLNSKQISYSDTKRAIEAWEKLSQEKIKISA